MSTANYCPVCASIVGLVEHSHRELQENRHDRPPTVETVTDWVCETCGSETDEVTLCADCREQPAECDDLCVECVVQLWLDDPRELADLQLTAPATGAWRKAFRRYNERLRATQTPVSDAERAIARALSGPA